MNKQKKIRDILNTIGTIVLLSGILWFFYLKDISYQLREGARVARESFDPKTEIGKANLIRKAQLAEINAYERLGNKYAYEGNYQNAIEEYKKALELTRKYNDGIGYGVIRSYLSQVYEYAGQYDLALQELNWLISRKPSKEGLDELIARRNSAEAALEGKYEIAASFAKKAYEQHLENMRQFYLIESAYWPKEKALERINEKIAKDESIKRYYEHWKHLESLVTEKK